MRRTTSVWRYDGSNLLDPYLATTEPESSDAPPWQHYLYYVHATIVAGRLTTLDLRFGDGLEFMLDQSGNWATCGKQGDQYYAVPCSWENNADFGTGRFVSAPIPEPGSYALFALGLAALAGVRKLRR